MQDQVPLIHSYLLVARDGTIVDRSGRFHIDHWARVGGAWRAPEMEIGVVMRLVAGPHRCHWGVKVVVDATAATTLFYRRAWHPPVSLGILPELELRHPRQVRHRISHDCTLVACDAVVVVFAFDDSIGGWRVG